MIKHINKPGLAYYKEPWMEENELNKFCTIVSEVSSFRENCTAFFSPFSCSQGYRN